MRRLMMLILLAILALGAWWYVTPWLAMKTLADAAAQRDLAVLEDSIDFPLLRERARAGVDEAVDFEDSGALGALAGMVVESVADAAIEGALTPQGVARLIETGSFAVALLPERLRSQDLTWEVERDGLSSFRGVGTFEDGTAGPVLHFERRGLGWQMTGFDLPGFG